MTASKKEKPSDLVAKFLRHHQSEKYNLDIYEVVMLRAIASYLDMPYGSCFASQKTLAYECRMSVRYVKEITKKLVKKGLITRRKEGKKYYYEISTDRCTICT